MDPRGYFITGTDTEIGKTCVSLGLIHLLRSRDLRVAAMKPVATGCGRTETGLVNEDALRLMRAASVPAPYARINPYAFEPPVSPHLAAVEAAVIIDLELVRRLAQSLAADADCLVVEGVGGWMAPLGRDLSVADMAAVIGLPVILVVGMRLGCLNHALLSAGAIRARGCRLAGWVANCIHPDMTSLAGNIDTLKTRLAAPYLGTVPFQGVPDAAVTAGSLELPGSDRAPVGPRRS